jgi:hypothetical protein
VPEDVLATANAEAPAVVDWCFSNAPRFFSDIEDLDDFTGAVADADVWDSSNWRSRGGDDVAPPPWDTWAATVQVRALLDSNLQPRPPIKDPWSQTGTDASQTTVAFNMVRPLLQDMARARKKHLEELRLCVESVSSSDTGLRPVAPTVIVRTIPFVHLMLSHTRGLRFPKYDNRLMQAIKDMNTFDGSLIQKSASNDSDQRAAPLGEAVPQQCDSQIAAAPLHAIIPLPEWNTQLEEDPIEDL